MIAALYVETNGPYAGLDGVEVWDKARDARTYAGPHPVVAHPPCARWSTLAAVVEAVHGYKRGDDGGCFAAALNAVRNHGGVLEHPANSSAWRWFGMCQPPSGGGWVNADWEGGWTCCVAQRNYGHRARKLTWLYAVGCDIPTLNWGDGDTPETYFLFGNNRPTDKRHTESGQAIPSGSAERIATPEPFRDLLLSMARSVSRD